MLTLSLKLQQVQVQLAPEAATDSVFPGLELAMKEAAANPEIHSKIVFASGRYASDVDYFFAMVFPAYRYNVFAYYDYGEHSIGDRYSKEEIETFENFLLLAWQIAVENGFQHGSRKFGVGKLQTACRLACRNNENSLLIRGMASVYHKQTLG
tara:strand:+ start:558 stop:1016 length:459 start_codon:yes stop_codon:yes gene_type:complete